MFHVLIYRYYSVCVCVYNNFLKRQLLDIEFYKGFQYIPICQIIHFIFYVTVVGHGDTKPWKVENLCV